MKALLYWTVFSGMVMGIVLMHYLHRNAHYYIGN